MTEPSPPPDPRPPAPGGRLESVRSELRRLGYLHHGVERFLLQDALRSRPPFGTLLVLATKVAVLVGLAVAAILALALAAANGNLAASPLDLLPLTLHLLVPTALAVFTGFLVLSALLVLLVEVYHVKKSETWAFGAAVAAGALALGCVLWWARDLVAELTIPELALLALLAAVAAVFLVRIVYHGLLSLTIRLTDLAPQDRLFSRRGLVLGVVSGGFLLTVAVALAAGRPADPAEPGSLPAAPGARVLVVGIDGILGEELDYLLARSRSGATAGPPGDPLAPFDRLAADGATFAYFRQPQAPAAFWTTVATGLGVDQHGVAALDSYRPLGVHTPLGQSGPLRWYWAWVAEPLGLAEHRPVLASRRLAHTFWELASRGGTPVAVVNWWATYPARPLPGMVVAHDAYTLLETGTGGAVEPAAVAAIAERVRLRVTTEADSAWGALPARTLGPERRREILESALVPDLFYLGLTRASDPEARVVAVYLPGLDIAADLWRGSTLAFGDLLEAHLAEIGAALGADGFLDRFSTVVVVADPGRRADSRAAPSGRALVWRRDGLGPCAARTVPTPAEPAELASLVLRSAGLPQSDELPDPPADCRWNPPVARVPSFGRRASQADAPGAEKYLENLRSLGYL